jgi:hypothetical protein
MTSEGESHAAAHAGTPSATRVGTRGSWKDRYDRLRGVLERNKIVYQTLTALLLSVMAAAQFCAGWKQTQLIKLQTEIARAQASPQFVIQARSEALPGEDKAAVERLYVSNSGSLAQEFSGDEAVFFRLRSTPMPASFRGTVMSATPVVQKMVTVPVNGYYGTGRYSGTGVGQVLMIEGDRNNERAAQLEHDLDQLADARGVDVKLDIQRYLRLSYLDIFGQRHTRFYLVAPVTGAVELDETQGRKIFADYRRAFQDSSFVEFRGLTAAILLQRLGLS